MSLTNYLSNIYEAYSPFLNRSSDTYESYEAVLSKPDLPAQKISVADFTFCQTFQMGIQPMALLLMYRSNSVCGL